MKCKKCKKEIENLTVCPYCKTKAIKDNIETNTKKMASDIDNSLNNIALFKDPYKLSNLALVGLLVYIIISIMYNYISDLGLLDLIKNDFFYLILTAYFILIKTKVGKKYFSYMNIALAAVLTFNFVASFFNILTTFNFTTVFSLVVDFLLCGYFINSFFYKYTKKLDLLKKFNNTLIFYVLSLVLIVLYFMLCFKYYGEVHIIKMIGYILQLLILIILSRYIYLYKKASDSKSNFLDMKKPSENLPTIKEAKELVKKYNIYQITAALIIIIGLITGVVIGDKSSVCSSYSRINDMCLENTFNFGSMLLIWVISIIVALIISSLGKIVELLSNINEKLDRISKKK